MANKAVVAFGPFKDFIADGVRMGDTIYLSGSVSVDEQGQTLHAGDIVKQAQQAYAHIAKVLEKFGAKMDDIAYETLFVTDMSAVLGDQEKMARSLARAPKHMAATLRSARASSEYPSWPRPIS